MSNGAQAGTTGQNRRMEAKTMVLSGAPPGTTIEYRAHLAKMSWTNWTPEGVSCSKSRPHVRPMERRLERMGAGRSDRGWLPIAGAHPF